MKRKGQIDGGIITFVAVVITLLFLAPILIKVVSVPLQGFSSSLSSIDSSNTSTNAVEMVRTKYVGLLDTVVLIMFLILIIVLLVSSFLVDIHPAFIILYIMSLMFLFILGPSVLGSLTTIWESDQFNDVSVPGGPNDIVSNLPMSQFILDNFFLIILGIAILSGIIMFAKFRSKSGGPY